MTDDFFGRADIATLVEKLRQGSKGARGRAVNELASRNDPAAIPPLQELVLNADAAAARLAADVLARLDDPGGLQDWAQSLVTHEKWEARRGAAVLLSRFDDLANRQALWLLADDEVKDVRDEAVGSLDRLGGEDLRGWFLQRSMAPGWERRLDAAVRLPAYDGPDIAEAVFRLAGDSQPNVREEARKGLRKLGTHADALHALALGAVRNDSHHVRAAACVAIGVGRRREDVASLDRALADGNAEVRAEAFKAMRRCDVAAAIKRAVRMLEDRGWEVRQHAAQLLESRPDPALIPALLRRMGDDDTDVRQAVLGALSRLDHDAAAVALALGLVDEDGDVREAAHGLLKESGERPGAARLRNLSPEVEQLITESGTAELEHVIELLQAAEHRAAVLSALDGATALGDWEQRQQAANVLSHLEGAEIGERLLALCKDPDEDVRARALRALVARDHSQAEQEVLVAMADRHDTVQKAALELSQQLDAQRLSRASDDADGAGRADDADWFGFKRKLDAVLDWGRQVGHAFLGEPVDIVALRRGAGQTAYRPHGRAVPLVEVSIDPLFESETRGAEVIKGVILHELGHQAFDFRHAGFKSADGAAKAEGVGHIFDLLLDERLERRLRAHDPAWGELLDASNAHLREGPPLIVPFADYARALGRDEQEVRAQVASKEIMGRTDESDADRVVLPQWGALAISGLLPPLHTFFFALLAVRDPSMINDERVRLAMSLVPANLKDVDHGELVRIAMAIGDALGSRDNGKRAARRLQAALREHGRVLASIRRRMERAEQLRAGHTPWSPGRGDAPAHRGPKQRQVVYRRQAMGPRRRSGPGGRLYNLGRDLGFPELRNEAVVPPDPPAHAEILMGIRAEVRRLRAHLERLGLRSKDEYASRRGQRLDYARVRQLALWGHPSSLVHTHDDPSSGAYVGLLIDKSSSMSGREMSLAKRFGILLAEAARSVPGLTGHVNAFDQSTFYRLGDFQRCSIAALQAGGSNNDCGALVRAADLALASGRRHKLLVMISDGSPTECSVAALAKLVSALKRRHGILSAQVAVSKLEDNAFPNNVDVSTLETRDAVNRFGRLLVTLSSSWS